MNNTKNKSLDFHNHLFMALERLGDEDLEGEKLEEELKRADAIARVAMQINAHKKLMLDSMRLIADYPDIKKIPLLLE
jgi:hypothetical protein